MIGFFMQLLNQPGWLQWNFWYYTILKKLWTEVSVLWITNAFISWNVNMAIYKASHWSFDIAFG